MALSIREGSKTRSVGVVGAADVGVWLKVGIAARKTTDIKAQNKDKATGRNMAQLYQIRAHLGAPM
jgi:hypothetical protein